MRAISLLFHDVYAAEPSESGFVSDAADRYKVTVAEFEAQLRGIAAVRSDAPILQRNDDGLPHADRDRSSAAGMNLPFLLTVDDGGVSYHTLLADRLEARGWRGHCFVTTDQIGQPGFLDVAQIRDLDRRGHVIGSHSASHPARFSTCSSSVMQAEWSRSRRVLEDLLGHAVTVASVPGGYYSARVAAMALDSGVRTLFTSEPVTTIADEAGCRVIGRFPIRRGDAPNLAQRLASTYPWARYAAWTSWNAKGLIKPLLGPSYGRVADWVLAGKANTRNHA